MDELQLLMNEAAAEASAGVNALDFDEVDANIDENDKLRDANELEGPPIYAREDDAPDAKPSTRFLNMNLTLSPPAKRSTAKPS